MKNNKIKTTLLAVLLFMFQAVQVLAERRDLPAPPKGAGGFDNGVVVGGPIDDYLPLLFLIGAIVGIWVLQNKKKFSNSIRG